MKSVKERLLLAAQKAISDRILTAEQSIASAKESKLNETKSSAGDKFETGRAMMQLEQEKSEVQLARVQRLKFQLDQLDISKVYDTVTPGSLILTDQLNYFISVGVGKIKIDQQAYYAISISSPIGQLMNGKSVGEQVQFRGQTITIKAIA